MSRSRTPAATPSEKTKPHRHSADDIVDLPSALDGAGRELASVQVDGACSGNIGTVQVPGLAVGETWQTLFPVVGSYNTGSPGDITVFYSPLGSGSYTQVTIMLLIDPLSGDTASAYDLTSGSVGAGTYPTLTDNGNTGTAFTWSGTGYRRSSSGPVVGWVQVVINRTA